MSSSMASAIRRTPPRQGRGGWHRGKARRDDKTPRKVDGRGDTACYCGDFVPSGNGATRPPC
jgi:hypothetical protein